MRLKEKNEKPDRAMRGRASHGLNIRRGSALYSKTARLDTALCASLHLYRASARYRWERLRVSAAAPLRKNQIFSLTKRKGTSSAAVSTKRKYFIHFNHKNDQGRAADNAKTTPTHAKPTSARKSFRNAPFRI